MMCSYLRSSLVLRELCLRSIPITTSQSGLRLSFGHKATAHLQRATWAWKPLVMTSIC